MPLLDDYNNDNVFAKIIRGEMPCYRIYEDESVLSFLDIFPQSEGHAIVIPKKLFWYYDSVTFRLRKNI